MATLCCYWIDIYWAETWSINLNDLFPIIYIIYSCINIIWKIEWDISVNQPEIIVLLHICFDVVKVVYSNVLLYYY